MTQLLKKLATYFRRPRDSGTFSSIEYWRERYSTGGNSGPGSYEHLAQFKADTLNAFVAEQRIASVIEFGCGDGNQLRYARYPSYTGYDISPVAVETCRRIFAADSTKTFDQTSRYDGEIYDGYMRRMFDSARRFVAIYSSNSNENPLDQAIHVRHRSISEWIATHRSQWKLCKAVQNPYAFDGDHTRTTFSDFYFYSRQ
jgi:SAM-dependent methyltransferase